MTTTLWTLVTQKSFPTNSIIQNILYDYIETSEFYSAKCEIILDWKSYGYILVASETARITETNSRNPNI